MQKFISKILNAKNLYISHRRQLFSKITDISLGVQNSYTCILDNIIIIAHEWMRKRYPYEVSIESKYCIIGRYILDINDKSAQTDEEIKFFNNNVLVVFIDKEHKHFNKTDMWNVSVSKDITNNFPDIYIYTSGNGSFTFGFNNKNDMAKFKMMYG